MIVGLRHAEVENPDSLVYARLPGFHLSSRGRREARSLGRALARAPLAAVYASPLHRARETAAALAEPHGLEVREDERLLEWSFWVRWQGMPWSRLHDRDPELLQRYASDPATASAEDPLEDVGRRVLDWAEDAGQDHPDGLVIGVTHEAPLVSALLTGSGAGLASFHATKLPHLGAVRLRPGPAQMVDLTASASA